jgi:hypothetical protein
MDYTFVHFCDICGWEGAKPGQLIACKNIVKGPWYCPQCNKELETVPIRNPVARAPIFENSDEITIQIPEKYRGKPMFITYRN